MIIAAKSEMRCVTGVMILHCFFESITQIISPHRYGLAEERRFIMKKHADIVICGAGIAGIATAHVLATRYDRSDILIVDPRPPMSLTSAASGENYRNW
jgi:cysteine synthase